MSNKTLRTVLICVICVLGALLVSLAALILIRGLPQIPDTILPTTTAATIQPTTQSTTAATTEATEETTEATEEPTGEEKPSLGTSNKPASSNTGSKLKNIFGNKN